MNCLSRVLTKGVEKNEESFKTILLTSMRESMLRQGNVLQAVDAIFVSDKDEVLLELLQAFPKRSSVLT